MKAGFIVLLVVILALGGGAFYWFQWRPSEIKKECAQIIVEQDKTGLSSNDIKNLLEFCEKARGL